MRNVRGSALATTLVILVFAAILSTALLRTSAFGKMLSSREASGTQAYYVAESALWRVFNNPNLIPSSLFVTGTATIEGLFDSQGKSYTVVIEELPSAGPNMFLASAYGSTPYTTRLASAEVSIRSITDMIGASAFHLGGMSLVGGQSSVPNFSSATGNVYAVKQHFSGSDVSIYGSTELALALKSESATDRDDPAPAKAKYYRHAYDSFNIWNGKFVLSDPAQLTAYDEHPDYYWDPIKRPSDVNLTLYPRTWLEGKHEYSPTLQAMPDLSDHIKQSLINQMVGGEWDSALAAPSDLSGYVLVGRGDLVEAARRFKNNTEPDPSWSYTPIRVQSDPIDKAITIVGCGALVLNTESTEIVIDQINLVGDLFIVGGDFNIRIDRVNTRGHRLVVISERSLRLGGSSNIWSPYPPSSTPTKFFLGPDSALWAREDLVIMGSLLPDTADGRADVYGPIIDFDYVAGELRLEDGVETWPKLTLVSKFGSLRYQYFKSSGLIYAGGNIEAFRTRLHGILIVNDPYRQGNDSWIGLHQANLSTDDSFESLTGALGIPEVMVEVKNIKR